MADIWQTAIFNYIFLNQKCCIFIQISPKFAPEGVIDNKSALVRVMAWSWEDAKLLPELIMIALN